MQEASDALSKTDVFSHYASNGNKQITSSAAINLT